VKADRVRQGLAELAAAATATQPLADAVAAMAGRYATTLAAGGTLFFAGNGGSAAHAQHLATEYLVRYRRDRRPLRAVALTTDGSALTAIGNDLGPELIFARQVEALAGPRDLVILHSTSGRSPNLIRAVEAARRVGAAAVAMLGGDGGELAGLVDQALIVPAEPASRIQEIHLAIEHLIVELVEEELGL
jgi:D-sedoheptulose 7-phosphate isomerase